MLNIKLQIAYCVFLDDFFMCHILGYNFIFLHRVIPFLCVNNIFFFFCEYLNLWAPLVA